ncbi:hypothetical protein GRI97_06575 [Altererythrobacter xixiisoli]|uniref:DUF5666 domain-containing protein n=2 Tax=Croceibacterium xixiisoli TaxID=1476466 RepID=A0A6I4TTT2_9SPHN|nr:hypothetical protein [Croceibacterium xixiisoli]
MHRKGPALAAVLAGALIALGSTSALAHHSFAVFFDSDRTIAITGTVTAFRFTNPHGTIALDARDSAGKLTQWRVETNAPVVLTRRGWQRDSIKPGDVITVDGWTARDGKPYLRLRSARNAQGQLIGQAAFGQSDD